MKIHKDMALVINMSGGKDSVRMLGYLCEKYPIIPKYAVYADTGFEHVKPVTAEEFARQRCAVYGLPLHVVRNPNKTYLEMVERRGMFPSSTTRQCTSDLKRGPIETWTRQAVKSGLITAKIIVNCTGIRAAESANRAKQKSLTRNTRLAGATQKAAMFGRTVWNWMPIFRETLADVLAWHRLSRTPLHPVYVPEYHWDGTTGGYLRRFSCRLCIFSTKADIRAIHANDPEAFYAVSDVEQRINFTMRAGESLLQIINQPGTETAQYGSEEAYEVACV